jgi:hypothetical protein
MIDADLFRTLTMRMWRRKLMLKLSSSSQPSALLEILMPHQPPILLVTTFIDFVLSVKDSAVNIFIDMSVVHQNE